MKKTLKTGAKRALCLFMALLFLSAALPAAETEAADLRIYGIDVSKWQGEIDWRAVAASGVDFAIIKCGSGEGADEKFERNYTAAKLAGLNVGSYFFSYARDKEQAAEEAEAALALLDGKRFEYPIYYDMEWSGQTSMTTEERMEIAVTFLDRLVEEGYYCGVYANKNWFDNLLDYDALTERYPTMWLARWRYSGTDDMDNSDLFGLWQYTDSGYCSGIDGGVDLDVSYVDYPAVIKKDGFNGYDSGTYGETLRGRYVTTENLRLRAGCGTGYETLLTVPKDTEISVLDFNGDFTWAETEYGGKRGYVSTDYINFKKHFEFEIMFDANDGNGPRHSVTIEPYYNFSLGALFSDGSWHLKRLSDGKVFVGGIGWTDPSTLLGTPPHTYYYWATMQLDNSFFNYSVGDDTFVFYAPCSHPEKEESLSDATCTVPSFRSVKCLECGLTVEHEEVAPALGHDPVTDEGHDATCTEAGLTDGSHCSVCGEVLTEQEEIPILPHGPVFKSKKPVIGTCRIESSFECSGCGEDTVTYEETETVFGNVDGSATVDFRDLLLMKKYLLGVEEEIEDLAGDLNLDGRVSSGDLLLLKRYLMGL